MSLRKEQNYTAKTVDLKWKLRPNVVLLVRKRAAAKSPSLNVAGSQCRLKNNIPA